MEAATDRLIRELPNDQPLALPLSISRGLSIAWRAGVASEPTLEPADLIARAERREGERLRTGHWWEALSVLTGELRRRNELTPLGKVMAHGQLVRLLRQRIRAERLWRVHPEITETSIKAPLLILGQMRSGTTRVHRLLSCDPRFAYTRLHETLTPISTATASSRAFAGVTRSFLHLCNSQLRHIHPTSPAAAEEEFGLHAFSIHGAMFEAQWHVPGFARWCEQRDLGPVYAEFRKLLQTLRWRRRDPVDKVQLLKAPQFMQDLDGLLEAFPDVRVLRLRRNMDEILASSASLVWNQQRIQSARATPQRVAAEWLRKTELREGRAEAALLRRPYVAVHEVRYDDMDRDWLREVRAIYRFLGLALTDAVSDKMRLVANSRKHSGHRYSAEQFGLAGRVSLNRPCR